MEPLPPRCLRDPTMRRRLDEEVTSLQARRPTAAHAVPAPAARLSRGAGVMVQSVLGPSAPFTRSHTSSTLRGRRAGGRGGCRCTRGEGWAARRASLPHPAHTLPCPMHYPPPHLWFSGSSLRLS